VVSVCYTTAIETGKSTMDTPELIRSIKSENNSAGHDSPTLDRDGFMSCFVPRGRTVLTTAPDECAVLTDAPARCPAPGNEPFFQTGHHAPLIARAFPAPCRYAGISYVWRAGVVVRIGKRSKTTMYLRQRTHGSWRCSQQWKTAKRYDQEHAQHIEFIGAEGNAR
jgi:hypothetical protein